MLLIVQDLVLIVNNIKVHFLVHVSWYLSHPACNDMGKPVQIWCNDIFDTLGFIPLDLYRCRCVHCDMLYKDEHVLVVIPLMD